MEEKTEGYFEKCEIIGNQDQYSIGILANKANLILNQCIINQHKQDGICIYLDQENTFEAIDCYIINN